MYLTMNRFKVKPDQAPVFEALWRNRDSYLHTVPGFKSFYLMKGPARADHILYASHTAWEDEASFLNWTKSEAFRQAHKGAGGSRDLYLEPPELEVFETIQALT